MLRGGCDFPGDFAVSRIFFALERCIGPCHYSVTRPSLFDFLDQNSVSNFSPLAPWNSFTSLQLGSSFAANALQSSPTPADHDPIPPSPHFIFFYMFPLKILDQSCRTTHKAHLQLSQTAAGRLVHISRRKGTTVPAHIISPSPSRQPTAVLDSCIGTVCITQAMEFEASRRRVQVWCLVEGEIFSDDGPCTMTVTEGCSL